MNGNTWCHASRAPHYVVRYCCIVEDRLVLSSTVNAPQISHGVAACNSVGVYNVVRAEEPVPRAAATIAKMRGGRKDSAWEVLKIKESHCKREKGLPDTEKGLPTK